MIKRRQHQGFVFFVGITLWFQAANAQTDDDGFGFSSAHVNATRDSDKTDSYAVGIDWLVMPDLRLNLTGVKTSNTELGDYTKAQQYIVGFSSDVLNTTTVGFDYLSTDYTSGIKTRSMQGHLALNFSDWSISLTPSLSPTEIDVGGFFGKLQIVSTGLLAKISAFSDGGWSGSLSYARYEYSREFTGLRLGGSLLSYVNAAAPGFIRGLESSYLGGSVTYREGPDAATFDYFRSKSYLNSVLTRRYTLAYSYDFSASLSSKMSVAKQVTDNRNDLFIYGLSLVYSW